MFSNETFAFFAKMEGGLPHLLLPLLWRVFLTQYFTHSETNFQAGLKTGQLIFTKSIYAFVRGLKLWFFCEILTVSKVLIIKCKTLDTVNQVGG